MKAILFAIIIVLITPKQISSQICKTYWDVHRAERFSYWYTFVICNNVTLQEYRPLLWNYGGVETTEYVLFENCNTPTIPVGVFTHIRHTNKVYLNNSNIQIINRNGLAGMMQVRELYLNNNNITKLLNGTFKPLYDLKLLDLSNNSLVKLDNETFSGLSKLQELNLANNHLYELSNCIFCTLTSLKSLDLSYNWIYNIVGDSFNNLFNLQTLLLNNNFIVHLPKSLLENTTKLTTLDFSYNKIPNFNFENLPGYLKILNVSNNAFKHMNDWSWLNKLEIIDLAMNDFSYISGIGRGIISLYFSGNYLETLDSSIFDQPEDLTCLDLCNTSLTEIKVDTFESLTKLETLNLSRNQIQYLPVGCFKNLTSLWELRLSYNYINNLEYGTFAGLDNLTVLFLDHNKLKIIHENSFYVLRNLKALYLNNNAIKSLDADEMVYHLTNIITIGLTDNDWTCKSLFNIIESLTFHNVGFFNGTDARTENVHGIACKSNGKENLIGSNETDKNQFAYWQNNVETRVIKQDIQNDKDLINSTFSKFFENLYTNSSFFNYFEKGFKKTNFFRYFNKDFYNSTFFRYFENDFKDSGFFKELNKNVLKKDSDENDSDEYYISNDGPNTTENLPEALEFHAAPSVDEQLLTFVNKITICLVVNVAIFMIMILLFLFVVFRRQNKLKFMKSETESLQNINLE